MANIDVQSLYKRFKVYEKSPGFVGSFRSLFRREYFEKSAVNDFSMQVAEGEMIGLLGPNGAGKTTLMKMCTGIVVPSQGSVRVLGYEPFRRENEFRRQIALVMGQKSQLWWDLPAMDSLQLLRAYYGVPTGDFKKRLFSLAERLQVEQLLKLHVRKLSLGERMKMELLACLLHNPRVLFLDEPTIGLDVVAQKTIREFLRDYHTEHRCSVILTSHYMTDVAALCSRVVLIQHGEKRFDGPLTAFEQLLGKEKNVTFMFDSPVAADDDFLSKFDPEWIQEGVQVALRIPESDLRRVSQTVLERFSVVDFHTEQLPIERVMSELMQNPGLLESQ